LKRVRQGPPSGGPVFFTLVAADGGRAGGKSAKRGQILILFQEDVFRRWPNRYDRSGIDHVVGRSLTED